MHGRRAAWLASLAVAVVLVIAPGSASAAAVGPGFFGVVPQATPSAADLDRMAGTVGTLRIPIYWFECEPRPGEYEFARLDAQIGAAADRGIRVLPFVYGSPPWLEPEPARPPLGSAAARGAWSVFLRQLVGRYGPGGDFWRGRERRLPIRRWQVWNEPNFVLFWRPRPSPAGYAQLLSLAAHAIRTEDPGAQIALAGVAPVGAGFLPWVFLRWLYRVPGVERSFDLVSLHPYASTIGRMREQVRVARSVMVAAGDAATPMLISELGVASRGTTPSAFVKGVEGQATFLRQAFRLLLARRSAWHIAGVDWFTWQDVPYPDPHCSFCEGAGLLDGAGRPKPAWWAFKGAVSASRVR